MSKISQYSKIAYSLLAIKEVELTFRRRPNFWRVKRSRTSSEYCERKKPLVGSVRTKCGWQSSATRSRARWNAAAAKWLPYELRLFLRRCQPELSTVGAPIITQIQYPLLLFEQLAVLYGSCVLNGTH